jgi:hypothetical protein
MRHRLHLPALVAGAMFLLAPATRAAPTKPTCIAAFDRAQQARREGALLRAREELLVCSQEECPALVRADCGGVLREVEAAQPTIVLKASDGDGRDVTDVGVALDGRKLATSLDGRAIPVDPGKLTLVFHRAPWEPVTVEILIAQGEKSRIVRAVLGPPPRPALLDPGTPRLAAERDASVAKRSAVGWGVPGGLLLASASALTFAGLTRLSIGNEADTLRANCAPSCRVEDRDRLASDLATANVALVVGLGGLALATITWFILAPKTPPRALAAGAWTLR